ncbi:MAG: hypothetical protein MRQ09_06230 [Candidatus Midichloria sp.]|nr:hypothetical protein [Candidatus Midichloria sp.]
MSIRLADFFPQLFSTSSETQDNILLASETALKLNLAKLQFVEQTSSNQKVIEIVKKSIFGLKTQIQGIQSLKEISKMEDSPGKEKALEILSIKMQNSNHEHAYNTPYQQLQIEKLKAEQAGNKDDITIAELKIKRAEFQHGSAQSYVWNEAIQYIKQAASDDIKNQVVEYTNNAIANLGTDSISTNGANTEPTRIIADFNKKILGF